MKAAERSLEALLQNNLLVRVAEMPVGEDPDSLVRKSGRETFEKLVEEAPEFFDYWTEKKASATNLHSLGDKMKVARELAETVSHVREPMMRREIINKIAARLAIRAEDFEKLIAQPRSPSGTMSNGTGSAYGKGTNAGTSNPSPPHDVAMLCLLALRDDDARHFLLEQNWRGVLPELEGADLLTKILDADVTPDDPASLNRFQTTLAPEDEALVSGWLLQRMPTEPGTVAREWWNGLQQANIRRELEVAESQLGRPNLTTGEIMRLQKQVLDLREQLQHFYRFSSARAHET
jgi:DNA primase